MSTPKEIVMAAVNHRSAERTAPVAKSRVCLRGPLPFPGGCWLVASGSFWTDAA